MLIEASHDTGEVDSELIADLSRTNLGLRIGLASAKRLGRYSKLTKSFDEVI